MCAVGGFSVAESSTLLALRPPEHVFLITLRQPVERVQVVDPAHHDHVASAGARHALRHQRDIRRQPDRRVGGAVDEAGDIAAVPVREPHLLGGELRHVVDGARNRPRVIPHVVGRAAADPEPCVMRGRRSPEVVHPLKPGEVSQRHGGLQRSDLAPSGRAEPGHDVHTARRDLWRAQPPERLHGIRWRHARSQVELQEVMRVRSLREDPELRKRERHIRSVVRCQSGRAAVDRWSRSGDSNPGPTTYEAVALPLSYSGGGCRVYRTES